MTKNQETKEQAMEEAVDLHTMVSNHPVDLIDWLVFSIRRNALYQIQYADYDINTWTAPVQLTLYRGKKLLHDASVRKIRVEIEI